MPVEVPSSWWMIWAGPMLGDTVLILRTGTIFACTVGMQGFTGR